MRPQERATELQGAAPKLEVRKGFEKGDKPKTLPKQMAQTEGQAGVCTPTDSDPDPGTAGEGAAAREAHTCWGGRMSPSPSSFLFSPCKLQLTFEQHRLELPGFT